MVAHWPLTRVSQVRFLAMAKEVTKVLLMTNTWKPALGPQNRWTTRLDYDHDCSGARCWLSFSTNREHDLQSPVSPPVVTTLAPGLTWANIWTISPANIWKPGNWRLNRGQGKNWPKIVRLWPECGGSGAGLQLGDGIMSNYEIRRYGEIAAKIEYSQSLMSFKLTPTVSSIYT